jgi:predicted nucleic acid-binding protein
LSVVDSSGWIEFFLNGPNATAFERGMRPTEELVVPTIVIVEVRRWAMSHGLTDELESIGAAMGLGTPVPLSASLAEQASDIGIRHRLPLADCIVYATAQSLGMEVWTQDRDFQGLPGVHYFPKT